MVQGGVEGYAPSRSVMLLLVPHNNRRVGVK